MKIQTKKWRPTLADYISLTDLDLSKIGLIVVCESSAKMAAASCLRTTEQLSFEEWMKTERYQFSQIVARLTTATNGVDFSLSQLIKQLDAIRKITQDFRNPIVHACWGEDASEASAIAYDFTRRRKFSVEDIDQAVENGAHLKLKAHEVCIRLGELVAEGVFPERPHGPGLRIKTKYGLIRL